MFVMLYFGCLRRMAEQFSCTRSSGSALQGVVAQMYKEHESIVRHVIHVDRAYGTYKYRLRSL
jgi:hypothetical protein